MDRHVKRAVSAIDSAIAEKKREITTLETARAALVPAVKRPRQRGARHTNARRAAGGAAIREASTVLEKVGRTTQAEIAKAIGKNSGTVSHALAVLESDGLVKKTGRVERRSPEWAWVGSGTLSEAA